MKIISTLMLGTLKRSVYESAEIPFSGCQNEENLLTRRLVPFNPGFHDSAKIAFSSIQNAENELKNATCPRNRGFQNSAKIAF